MFVCEQLINFVLTLAPVYYLYKHIACACVLACVDCSGGQVFASIEVPPVRQALYLRGTKLIGANTLRVANVKAGDTLHLKARGPTVCRVYDMT